MVTWLILTVFGYPLFGHCRAPHSDLSRLRIVCGLFALYAGGAVSLGHDASTKSLLHRQVVSRTDWIPLFTPANSASNAQAPEFVTPPDFYRFGWYELVRSLFAPHAVLVKDFSASLFSSVPLLRRRIAAKPLSASLVAHLLMIPLLPFLLQVVPRRAQIGPENELQQHEIVYYHFTNDPVRPRTPKLAPKGPGGQPGIGDVPQLSPKKGASVSLGNLTIVSRPRIPDNDHQTILQVKSPADLKIQQDLTLPNLVLGQPAVQRPHLEFNVNEVRPVQPTAKAHTSDEPSLTRVTVDSGVNGMIGLATSQPHLPVPVGGASASPRIVQRGGIAGKAEAPVFTDAESGSDESGLLILGTNHGSSSQVVALPPGNRYGEFEVAAGGGGGGSPGGVENGHAGGGAGGKGSGGDGSSGSGGGSFGGGGGSGGTNGFVSLSGNGEVSSGSLGDPPAAAAQLVFAIPESMLLRHNKLVVSAGPMGGGGSSVYGVLPCGRIYTIFLATGQKQWSLQYCQKSASVTPESSSNRARLTVVHTELPILPPEAETRFNFKRMSLPPEKASKSILLRGVITEEGKVENVEVYQGLMPLLDEAARKAFQQWKFKPAMRSGEPLRVEILLSIPME